MMKYLVLYPSDEKDIRLCMEYWLSEAGGSLSWYQIELNLFKRFQYFPGFIYERDEAEDMGLLHKAYKVENGKVSYF